MVTNCCTSAPCMALKFWISLHLSTFLLSTSLGSDNKKKSQMVTNGNKTSNWAEKCIFAVCFAIGLSVFLWICGCKPIKVSLMAVERSVTGSWCDLEWSGVSVWSAALSVWLCKMWWDGVTLAGCCSGLPAPEGLLPGLHENMQQCLVMFSSLYP